MLGGYAGRSSNFENERRVWREHTLGRLCWVFYCVVRGVHPGPVERQRSTRSRGDSSGERWGGHGIAFWAEWFATREDDLERYTFGRGKTKALAAIGSVLVLAFVVMRDILPEAVLRLWEPQPVRSLLMLGVALGIFGWNALLKLLLRSAPHEHHFRGSRLKVNFDFYGALFVAVAALLIRVTGWLW